jgi:TIR domain
MSTGAQTPKIIVSYRRTDSAMAGRIFDRLVQRFGKKSLFIDIDNIPFGCDFRKHIDDALKSSDLLIALVGAKWIGGEGKDAKITRDADPVRVEIETARIQLPGWDNCIVSDWTTQGKIIRYYGCEIPSVPTAEEMHAKRDTAVSYLESCLGKDWIKTRKSATRPTSSWVPTIPSGVSGRRRTPMAAETSCGSKSTYPLR